MAIPAVYRQLCLRCVALLLRAFSQSQRICIAYGSVPLAAEACALAELARDSVPPHAGRPQASTRRARSPSLGKRRVGLFRYCTRSITTCPCSRRRPGRVCHLSASSVAGCHQSGGGVPGALPGVLRLLLQHTCNPSLQPAQATYG